MTQQTLGYGFVVLIFGAMLTAAAAQVVLSVRNLIGCIRDHRRPRPAPQAPTPPPTTVLAATPRLDTPHPAEEAAIAHARQVLAR